MQAMSKSALLLDYYYSNRERAPPLPKQRIFIEVCINLKKINVNSAKNCKKSK